jgi:hypothetical protein
VGFDTNSGTFIPIDNWANPYYKVPGLDNGEWFWALYALVQALDISGYTDLSHQYNAFMQCQKENVKTIFYRGNGDVSAVVKILDPFVSPTPSNYEHSDGYLNDPYEGETVTQMLYLFSGWDSEAEREMLWEKKRGLLQAANFTLGNGKMVTVQVSYYTSIHPYIHTHIHT